jgi:hypothetical protein
MTKKASLLVPLALITALLSCSLPTPYFSGETVPPLNVVPPTPMPAAEVIFSAAVPEALAPGAEVALVLLDEVTGMAYNQQSYSMVRISDRLWQVRLTPPAGALLHYRYKRLGTEPAEEIDRYGRRISSRVALIAGPGEMHDVITAWADAPYEGPTGRVTGQLVSSEDGQPLPEMLVNVAGRQTFSDALGNFRIDGLPPGLHRVTAFSSDGAYHTAQQEAQVAADSATPARLALTPAKPIQATFQVTVPEDTTPGVPVLFAGNQRQFGELYTELPSGSSTNRYRMPSLVYVDPTHYLMLATLFEGMDLRYKYTLGDGLWNAERDGNRNMLTRRLIVPDHDITIQDTVATWNSGEGPSLLFHATAPGKTPAGDEVTLQLNPVVWFDPLPMWQLSEDEWFYALRGPLSFSQPLSYRYCRNALCSGAVDLQEADDLNSERDLLGAPAGQEIQDEIFAWKWEQGGGIATSVVAPERIPSRPEFEVGVEIAPAYQPFWARYFDPSVQEIGDLGANSLTLTPTWVWEASQPLPSLEFDPTRSPFSDELASSVRGAYTHGLRVNLRATTVTAGTGLDTWWATAPRVDAWWTTWFDEYRSFVLTIAQEAQSAGAEKLIIGGPEVAPALPDGQLADGSASGAPADAGDRWRALIAEVRQRFSGRLAFEIEYGEKVQRPPDFLEDVDEIHVYWHAALTGGPESDFEELEPKAAQAFTQLLSALSGFRGKPIRLSVEYLSILGSSTGCAPTIDQGCRPPAEFDQGADPDPDLQLDLEVQATVINAVMLEAYNRSQITGFYTRRYNPITPLRDKSASVHGKPAQDVLWYWYPRITGAIAQ